MGHLTPKNVYRKLGSKIDKLKVRAPWNEALYKILKELYTEIEADVVVKMPYGLSTIERIATLTGYPINHLTKILESLAEKGLVVDLYHAGESYYFPSPLIDGFGDYTMMRTKGKLDTKLWAELFHSYWTGSDAFHKANFSAGQKAVDFRALPHTGAVAEEDAVEILPYEKAEMIVDRYNKFAIGICACRHESYHLGIKTCDVPMRTCIHFGVFAEWISSHGMAKEVSQEEVVDTLERSKNLGTVFSAENSQNVKVICCCCSCCCGMIRSINDFGYHNAIMTSSFIAEVHTETCVGCGECIKACPIHAIVLEPAEFHSDDGVKKSMMAKVDRSICLGCGLCALNCKHDALKLKKRKQKVIHPATTFERNILSCLEKGTLQYQLFDDPQSISHAVMRGLVGGFLKLTPVKRAFMSDMFRSRFLNVLTDLVKKQGLGWVLEL